MFVFALIFHFCFWLVFVMCVTVFLFLLVCVFFVRIGALVLPSFTKSERLNNPGNPHKVCVKFASLLKGSIVSSPGDAAKLSWTTESWS